MRASLAALSAAILLSLIQPSRADLAGDCKPFFAAASAPPKAMAMNMPGMLMLDSSSGPMPLVCLTIDDKFEPPVFDNIGAATIQVSDDPTVQLYFAQGLRFYMGFNNRESYRAFRYAADLAAKKGKPCVWCYWGTALPLGVDINMTTELELDREAANRALDKAMSLRPTGLIARLVLALAKRSQNCGQNEKIEDCQARRNREYNAAMVSIMAANPNDPNVAVLYVDSILNLTPWHLPDPDNFKSARDTLERLMPANFSHQGLVHWYIHLMELSNDPGRAATAAKRLALLAPKAGHLVHMPSHIFYRIGEMREAVSHNIEASDADDAYFHDPRNPLKHPDGDRYRYGYYPHTLHFLAAGATLDGDKARLEKAAERLYLAPPPDAQGYRKDKYREVYYLARVNFATPDEIRKFRQPDGTSKVQPRANVAYAYAQVMADLWQGVQPTGTLPRFETALKDYPVGPDPDAACRKAAADPHGDTGLCMAAIENNLVQGRIAAIQRNWNRALTFTDNASKLQRALSYDEPPDWLYSLHQSFAGVLIRKVLAEGPETQRGQLELRQAKERLLQSLDVHLNDSTTFPGNGWAYFGLWQVAKYRHGDNPKDAERLFRQYWRDPVSADVPSLNRM